MDVPHSCIKTHLFSQEVSSAALSHGMFDIRRSKVFGSCVIVEGGRCWPAGCLLHYNNSYTFYTYLLTSIEQCADCGSGSVKECVRSPHVRAVRRSSRDIVHFV